MVELRKNFLNLRNKLSSSDQEKLSHEITQRLLSIDKVLASHVIFIYVNFRSEVQTANLVEILLQRGKQVVAPVTLVTEKKLLPVTIYSLSELDPGYCSIPEPRLAIRETRLTAGADIDLVVVPGSVFDCKGGRMGYGGGYYDRFLAHEAPQAYRVGLAYEMQVIENLRLQPHDELMDIVVTEKRCIYGTR